MSFFGFNSALPRDRPHNSNAPGFGSAPDAFASLARRDEGNGDDDVLDFDTYDDLGDRLDDADDVLNDDTFGTGTVGRDFDFAGQTASMRGDLLGGQQQPHATYTPPQQASFSRPPQPSSSTRTGYEKYKQPDYIPQLQASADIWGTNVRAAAPPSAQSLQQQPQRHHPPQPQLQQQYQEQPNALPSIATVTRKMMSLEEVEAAMRAQPQGRNQSTPNSITPQPQMPAISSHSARVPQQLPHAQHPTTMGIPPHQLPAQSDRGQDAYAQVSAYSDAPQILQRQAVTVMPQPELAGGAQQVQMQSADRGQQPGLQYRQPPQTVDLPQIPQMATMHNRGPSYNGPAVTHPNQMMPMSESDRAAFLQDEAKRAKRNHKIHQLSRDNGLMTPQDKNYITRIQLQQLITATGGLDDQSSEASLAEDFYYQVYSQIRGARSGQSSNLFAQTYLNQTGGRGNRRFPRGGDQMRRMEQQVQRAVEAAKLKPKTKQLVIEGSLGKISFSNAKTPKPLLNLKRQESQDQRPRSAERHRIEDPIAVRKAVLKDIEGLYSTLLAMEDHERRMPPPTTEDSSADDIQAQMDWRQQIQGLNARLWTDLKVLEPIDPAASTPHPFIAILSHPKGKKLIPRVFRQVDDQQRLTILTMIVVHLDMLDVIRYGYHSSADAQLPLAIRNEVDLFNQAVMPGLFAYVNEAPLDIIIGLVGLITERVNVPLVIRTKVGVGLLTMFISRAELLKQGGHTKDADWEQWLDVYNRLFDTIEPYLPDIFTTPITSGEDIYVWQFLAALGIAASPDQQQRLVLGVKDRVMDTVSLAKTLSEDQAAPRLANVNLFMRAIGLDVELLG